MSEYRRVQDLFIARRGQKKMFSEEQNCREPGTGAV